MLLNSRTTVYFISKLILNCPRSKPSIESAKNGGMKRQEIVVDKEIRLILPSEQNLMSPDWKLDFKRLRSYTCL